MKKSFSVLGLIFLSQILFAQKVYVPDDNFESFLENNAMGDGILNNDSASLTSILAKSNLYISGENIEDFTGIESFINLNDLDLSNNYSNNSSTLQLDLTALTQLEYFDGSINRLDSIRFSNLAPLEKVYLSDNNFVNFYPGTYPSIEFLDLNYNQLLELDLLNNTNLKSIKFINNLVDSIDLSNSPNLLYIDLSNNNIQTLDLSQQGNLLQLTARYNQIKALDFSNSPLLTHIHITGNQIDSIDVNVCPNLIDFEISSNNLTQLDVSQLPDLKDFDFAYNSITSIDVSANSKISKLACDFNSLNSLDLGNLSKLTYLSCSNNPLTCLNIKNGNNHNISRLKIQQNPSLSCVQADYAGLIAQREHIQDSTTQILASCPCANNMYCKTRPAQLNSVICSNQTFSSPSGKYLWDTTGTYIDTLIAPSGCDSIISINLLKVEVDSSIQINNAVISSNITSARFQWLDCNNNYQAIPGDTNSQFQPFISGNYALELTLGSCKDTSNCYPIVITGNQELASKESRFEIYPNPSHGGFYIYNKREQLSGIRIYTMGGKLVYEQLQFNQNKSFVEAQLPDGIYLVEAISPGGIARKKLIVNH